MSILGRIKAHVALNRERQYWRDRTEIDRLRRKNAALAHRAAIRRDLGLQRKRYGQLKAAQPSLWKRLTSSFSKPPARRPKRRYYRPRYRYAYRRR